MSDQSRARPGRRRSLRAGWHSEALWRSRTECRARDANDDRRLLPAGNARISRPEKKPRPVIRNARMRPRVMVKAPTAFQGLAHPKGEVALWVRVTGIHGPAASPFQCGERSKPTTGKPAETGRHPTSCDVEGRVSVGIGSRLSSAALTDTLSRCFIPK